MNVLRFFPWKILVRWIAKANGIADPIMLLTRMARFGKLSDIGTPGELLKSGSVLHARGLVNSQAIQHNLDWVWPFWVNRQFDPHDVSFIPRAFSLTHINLSHRNWTAVGLPSEEVATIVDPRGLVTPFYDGWSLDCWIGDNSGLALVPAREQDSSQRRRAGERFAISTTTESSDASITSTVRVLPFSSGPVCMIDIEAAGNAGTSLVVSVRPYNPEGISFVKSVKWDPGTSEWEINGLHRVGFDSHPDGNAVSTYRDGDVAHNSSTRSGNTERQATSHGSNGSAPSAECEVGMATAASVFDIPETGSRRVTAMIPLSEGRQIMRETSSEATHRAAAEWEAAYAGAGKLQHPDDRVRNLYLSALETLLLHTVNTVYAGSFTYRSYWVRDAALISNALLCAGFTERSRGTLHAFFERQTRQGYFLSHSGEWDANGEVLWMLDRYITLSGESPPEQWKKPIRKGADWICKKLLSETKGTLHDGLLPPSFSAEHFGPVDYYYWDDFWAVAGLRAAERFSLAYGDFERGRRYRETSERLLSSINSSVEKAAERSGDTAVPASPYRRVDSSAVGSLVAGYPLGLWLPGDIRLLATADRLVKRCTVRGGFFHDMSHSGINPYLTLHIAQVLMRGGDARFADLIQSIGELAGGTGTWPEAIHPATGGGCMGDGDHVWAAAEWIMAIRNSFLREEGRVLVIGAGISERWRAAKEPLVYGPVPTEFGRVEVEILPDKRNWLVRCRADWRRPPEEVRILLPGTGQVAGPPKELLEVEVG